jgi:3-oxoacyl-[acyl-carrier protein] reductase
MGRQSRSDIWNLTPAFDTLLGMATDGVSMRLPGKVAVISGGSRGIGAAAVRMFVRAGAKVIFNYQKRRDAAYVLVNDCGSDNCHAVQADLSSVESGKILIDAAVERFGACDIVIGNHGIWPPDDVPVDVITPEHWRRSIAINLDSIFGLVKYGTAQLKKQGRGGSIVLVSSTAGQRGEAFHCDYAAAKGAIISMVKGLSTELARDHIRVNCVAPGWVDTEMAAPALNDAATRERALRVIPLGRVGTPDEIAAPILFLCTEHAGFITGEIFNVNGGAVLVG